MTTQLQNTRSDLETAAGTAQEVRAGGETIGRADAVYYDRETGEPRWLAISGSDGRRLIAPAVGARAHDGHVHVAHPAARVRSAPHVAGDTIPATTETELARHFGLLADASTAVRPPVSRTRTSIP